MLMSAQKQQCLELLCNGSHNNLMHLKHSQLLLPNHNPKHNRKMKLAIYDDGDVDLHQQNSLLVNQESDHLARSK